MSRNLKRLVLIALDSGIIFLSFIISYFILYPLVEIKATSFFIHVLVISLIYIIVGLYIKMFDKINRFVSIREIVVMMTLIVFSYISGTILFLITALAISLRFLFLSFIGTLILIPTTRIAWRILIESIHRNENSSKATERPTRVLLIGAGDGGAIFVRALRKRTDVDVVGFLDDDPDKQGTILYQYPIIGSIKDLKDVVKKYKVEQVTIAIPSLKKERLTSILELTKDLDVKVNQMPYIEDIVTGEYQLDEFKEIEITNLLGRDEVELDTDVIDSQIVGKKVLISGAGGSIGSEIARQVSNFGPKEIILLGHGEFSIYKIHRELKAQPARNYRVTPVIADIQDRERIFEVMENCKPDIVYHAAAHKHVPLMEENPWEAVKNNIYGTKNMGEASKHADVSTFVMVSTDKAVNPPNVMGSTKRIAEMIITGLNEEGHTNFASVRFGNVLNSSGSVIPVFKEQIAKGGPITVTDFRMTRYFMTIPEASRLVLQAGALAAGGEIFVLDMDEPVKILDLAKQMIWLSGHSETEIGIIETGIRPGEKLYETLLASDENVVKQVFEKIFVGKVQNLPIEQVLIFLKSLETMSQEEIKKALVAFANNSNEENLSEIKEIKETISI